MKKVAAISDDQIKALVQKSGPKGAAGKHIIDTLIEREKWLSKE